MTNATRKTIPHLSPSRKEFKEEEENEEEEEEEEGEIIEAAIQEEAWLDQRGEGDFQGLEKDLAKHSFALCLLTVEPMHYGSV